MVKNDWHFNSFGWYFVIVHLFLISLNVLECPLNTLLDAVASCSHVHIGLPN